MSAGADIIDAAAEEAEAADGPAALTLERCLDILVAFHTLPTGAGPPSIVRLALHYVTPGCGFAVAASKLEAGHLRHS